MTSFSQLAPWYPAGHEHVCELTPSVQLPPFLHGLTAQSSIFVEHVGPVNPTGQVQLNPVTRVRWGTEQP